MIDFANDPRGLQLRLLLERAKYERQLQSEVQRLLTAEYNKLADILLSRGYRDLTAFQKQRTAQMLREIGDRLGAAYRDVTTLVLDEMKQYAQVEADLSREIVRATLEAGGGSLVADLTYRLPKAYIEAIASFPVHGLRISEWFDAQARSMTLATKQVIQTGLIAGKGPAEIARKIVAPLKTEGPVVYKRAVTEAKAVTRTVVNAVQNDATRQSYAQLPASVSDSWRFVAVRDNRTTVICLSLDGKVFRFDDPTAPWPPRHVGCRSTSMALIRGVDMTLAEQKSQPITFRSMSDWLTAQPTTTQNDLLGPTRAGWFRDGKMSLSDAVDADSRVLTLAHLRAKLGLDAVVHQ